MDPLLYSGVKSTVCRMAGTGQKPSKAPKDAALGRKGDGVNFLGFEWHTILGLSRKGKNDHRHLLDRLNAEIKKKRPHLAKKKVLFHQDNAPVHTCMKTMAKLHELRYELVGHPPYSPHLAPSDYYLFPNLKNFLQEKRCILQSSRNCIF